MTRAVRTAQFGCSSLRTSATYKESREARLSLIPYRTRKSENGESRVVDSVCAGIDSRKSVQPIMSKERNAVESRSLHGNPPADQMVSRAVLGNHLMPTFELGLVKSPT